MNVVKDFWTKQFIPNTYSCIEGRGINKCVKDLKRDLRRCKYDTDYCLKLDIKKFYPSINHDCLKQILSRKIKDVKFLQILYEIIDSVNDYVDNPGTGVPIGNYLSQYFANLYLSEFDRWCKQELHCQFYYRYCDDIVILSNSKEYLHKILICIKLYLKHKLKLQIKDNYQIFPVESRGIDFVGYVFRHNYTRIRKGIKLNVFNLIKKYKKNKINRESFIKSLVSYLGIFKHANSKYLLHKLEKELQVKYSNFKGKKDKISNYYNKNVYIVNVSPHGKYYNIEFIYNNKPIVVSSKNIKLFFQLRNNLPLHFTFTKPKYKKQK